MVELDNYKVELSSYEQPLAEVRDSLNLGDKRYRIEELEKNMEAPDFWDDSEKASQAMKEVKDLKDIVGRADGLQQKYEDIMTLIEMAYEEEDEELAAEIGEELAAFTSEFDDLRITTMLTGEYDDSNAILTLHAGAGGTESCDWASMLCRMYQRWAEKKGYSVEMLDFLDGEEAGLKSVTLQINGTNAYGYLKSEHGVHRLVRISPFNAAGKRQTSFVSCDVMPDIEQDERSQHMNKDKAMQMLKAKLYLLKQQENREKESDIRGEQKEIGWGNQIRSYVMQPYTMVKDHRTNVETGNVAAVMDGDLDIFINGYLKWINS